MRLLVPIDLCHRPLEDTVSEKSGHKSVCVSVTKKTRKALETSINVCNGR